MDEAVHKRRVGLSLLLGIPIIAAAGTLAVLGLAVAPDCLTAIELLWAGAGLIGLLAWGVLAGLFLWRGQAALCAAPWPLWGGLGLGVLAAVGMVAVAVHRVFTDPDLIVLAYLFLGPPLLLPAAHLAWLRWARAATLPPAPG